MIITLITATLNSSAYIPGLLDCIKQQSFQDIELIVIDGGSTDGTIEQLQQSEIISQLVLEKDKGIYYALNKGIQLAKGDIIGFLHSDDILATSETLKHIAAVFNSAQSGIQKQVDVVYGDLYVVEKKNTEKVIRYWKSQSFNPSMLYQGWMPAHPSVFMRHDVYKKHGRFDLSFSISSDYDYLLRVFNDKTLRFKYLPEVITKMRIGGISNRNLKNIIIKSKEDFLILKKNNIPFPLWVLFLKNILKFPQFYHK